MPIELPKRLSPPAPVGSMLKRHPDSPQQDRLRKANGWCGLAGSNYNNGRLGKGHGGYSDV